MPPVLGSCAGVSFLVLVCPRRAIRLSCCVCRNISSVYIWKSMWGSPFCSILSLKDDSLMLVMSHRNVLSIVSLHEK